jgi:translation initiation factor 5A
MSDSLTYPQKASACRKGSYLMIDNHPCKIIEMSTSKTGKHGHAKCKFMAKDIFDQSQHEFVQTSTHNVDIPNVSRKEYQLSDIDEEGYLSLLDDNAEMRSDLQLPDNIELSDNIRKIFDNEEDCAVTVLSACDREMIIDVKKITT